MASPTAASAAATPITKKTIIWPSIEFKNLAKNLAMQVAAMDPASIDNDNDSLMEQQYIKDSDKLIKELVQEVIAQTGENIKIKRFQRFEVGGE